MTPPDDKIIQYVEDLLKDARDALKEDQLEKAQDFYKEALSIEDYPPDFEDDIRQELKAYSDAQHIERSPPKWDQAQQTLLRFGQSDSRDVFASIINDLKSYSSAQVRNYAAFSQA